MNREEVQEMIREVVGEHQPAPVWAPAWAERLFSKDEKEVAQGTVVAQIIRALAAGKGDPERGASFAKKNWTEHEDVVKALGTGTGAAGGFLVPPEFSAEIIALLRPQSVVRRMGATTLPMDTGTLNIPRITGGAMASYIGENTNLPRSLPGFGQITLTWKKLGALVPISNDLLRFSSPAADTVVRDDLVAAMAQREDAAFIRDDGASFRPRGILHQSATANRFSANATVNLANVTTDLGLAVLRLRSANVRFIRPGWIISPRTEFYLMSVRDANSNFAFRAEMLGGRLYGYPFAVTTQIPENLGAGTNESEVYLVDFADAIIGEATQLMIDASTEAAYHDGTAVVAAFSLDQTIIRVIAQHDFALRYDLSAAVIQAVRWGV